jgi:hypothetical protein
MLTIYQIGAGGYWTGATREIGEKDGTHRGWTRAPVPTLAAGEYAVWSANGWKVTTQEYVAPIPPPPPIPSVISMRQARLVLLSQGLLVQVDATIDAMDEPARSAAQIEWEYATELRRDNPLVTAMQASMSLTDAQVDAMFTAGAAIP